MSLTHASIEPGEYAVDYGHKVDLVECVDESGFGAREVQSGMRRAEEERCHVAELLLDHE